MNVIKNFLPYLFPRDLIFAAMHRSGHHAIIEWVKTHSLYASLHYNDVNHQDPNFKTLFEKEGRSHFLSMLSSKLKIVSFEDVSLDYVGLTKDNGELNNLSNPLTVLVLRDAYNMFASRLVKARGKSRYSEDYWIGANTISLWKKQAQQYIELESRPRDEIVLVNFNQWVSSEHYRARLARTLRLKLIDNYPHNRVSPFGGGSSFDRMSYDHRASDMSVNERWKKMVEDKIYRNLFDRETKSLCSTIFDLSPLC